MTYDKTKFTIKKDARGNGVYAARLFKKGEIIHTLHGTAGTPKNVEYHGKNFKKGIIDPLQIGSDTYLTLDSFSVNFNHSCSPSAGMKNLSTLFALQDIKKGEEITFDYSTTVDEAFWCICKSKNCRGVIYDFFALPARDQKRYYAQGALPNFLKKKYSKLLIMSCPCESGKKFTHCHGK